ncbi:hypothetical protein GX408_15045 [bacterium]|nr:hypothetical protein [bacterium]
MVKSCLLKKGAWLLCGALAAATLYCSRPADEEEMVVGRMHHHTVTMAAFIRSYINEFLFSSVRNQDSPQARHAHVQNLAVRHLLAQKAVAARMDTLPGFRTAMHAESTAVIIHALYEHEIAAALPPVSDQDVRTAFAEMNRDLHVRHLVSPTRSGIDSLYAALKKGATFYQLAETCFRDSILAATGGDLGVLKWGDLDLPLEEAAYRLRIGEVSPPVEGRVGWHILKLENILVNPILREDEFQAYREIIRGRIRYRRLLAAAERRIKQMMTEKDVRLNVPLIQLLERERRQTGASPLRTSAPMEILDAPFAQLLDKHAQEVLAEFDGGRWTVADFKKHVSLLPRGTLDEGMYRAVALSLRNYFLLQIAERKRVAKKKAVVNEIREKRDHLLSNVYVHHVADTLRFSEAEYRGYYETVKRSLFQDRAMDVYEILLKRESQARQLMQQLLPGPVDVAKFRMLAQRYTQRPGMKNRQGHLGLIHKGDYGAIGQACAALSKGGITGPVAVPEGFAILLLADSQEGFTPYERVRDRVVRDAEARKVKLVYEGLRSRVLQENPLTVDTKLLTDYIYMSSGRKQP